MSVVEEVLEKVAVLVEPNEEERKRLNEIASLLLEECRSRFNTVEGFVSASIEGSAAKDTWLKSKPELDIFIHFLPGVSREAMEEAVIKIGGEVMRRIGGQSRLRYAEHPYVEGFIDNITVNIVGCYEVSVGKWISAVDRTPYHTQYVNSRLTPTLRRDVRILKSFLTSAEIYGAEIKVGGFSGYLSELLIIHYGGFLELLKSASRWRPPVIIDIEGKVNKKEALTLFSKSPLIVIDPVDKNRNVASAVTLTKLSEFILASKIFLKNPSTSYFMDKPMPVSDKLESLAEGRELFAIVFNLEEYIPPDVIWGELRRSAEGIKKRFEMAGFDVYSYGINEHEGSVAIIFELDKLSLPARFVHRGPPVWMDDALRFVKKHLSSPDTVAGPWIEDDRVYVLKKREETMVDMLLKKWLAQAEVSISKQLYKAFSSSRMIVGWKEVLKILGTGIHAPFLNKFLTSRPVFMDHILRKD
ncbi:MAG: CCA tRNA nucleotidyltransferase [Nitrososphaerota archaeon]